MKSIILTGMSGAGKTTVACELAKIFADSKIKIIDTDLVIVQNEKLSIQDIFAQKGEKYFRELEAKTIKDVFKNENIILSLGGGAFEREETRNLLLNNAVVIYLEASGESILKRLQNTKDRPLLNNMNLETINNLLEKRKKNYELAHIRVLTDNKNVEQITKEILQCVNWK